ncbi:MAG: type II toxin-antitoxin system VapC family toxin [Acidimicrobiales bacterium]
MEHPRASVNVVYDAGVLVDADRSDRAAWADHRARLELGLAPVTTAPVVAQVSRSARQAQLRRFLRGCVVVPFAPDEAHVVGALLGKAGSSDVTDGHVVTVAALAGATVLTADVDDLARLSACLDTPVPIVRI